MQIAQCNCLLTQRLETAHVDFYSNLFAAELIDLDCEEKLFSEFSKHFSDPDCVICEGVLSSAELMSSLKTLNTDKTMGADGFTAEFYVKFWNLLGPLLTAVIKNALPMVNYVKQ